MKFSKHLNAREFQQLSEIMGPRKESLSTTIVQLLFATPTRPSTWQVKITGVACFIKDSDPSPFTFTTQDFTHRALLTTRTPVSSKIFGFASIRVRVTTFFSQGSGFHLFKSRKNVKSPRVWQQSRNSRRISPGLGSKVQIIILCF